MKNYLLIAVQNRTNASPSCHAFIATCERDELPMFSMGIYDVHVFELRPQEDPPYYGPVMKGATPLHTVKLLQATTPIDMLTLDIANLIRKCPKLQAEHFAEFVEQKVKKAASEAV